MLGFDALGQFALGELGLRSTNVAGVSATGQQGTIVPSVAALITGVAGSGSFGTLNPAITVTLASVTAFGQSGTITPSLQAFLTGVAGSASPGTVAPAVSTAPSGVAGTGSPGSLALAVAPSLVGVQGVGAIGPAVMSGMFGFGALGQFALGEARTASGVAAKVSISLTGVAGTAAPGVILAGPSAILTGVEGVGHVGTLTFLFSGGSGGSGYKRAPGESDGDRKRRIAREKATQATWRRQHEERLRLEAQAVADAIAKQQADLDDLGRLFAEAAALMRAAVARDDDETMLLLMAAEQSALEPGLIDDYQARIAALGSLLSQIAATYAPIAQAAHVAHDDEEALLLLLAA